MKSKQFFVSAALSLAIGIGLALVGFQFNVFSLSQAQAQGERQRSQITARVQELHIGHLVAPDAPLSGYASAERMKTVIQAEPLHTALQLQQAHVNSPLDVLIIDRSARQIASPDMLRRLYNQGVVLVGMNLSNETFESLLPDGCLSLSNLASYDEPRYIMVTWRVSGDNQQEIQQVLRSYDRTCGQWTADNLPDVDGEVHVMTHRSTDTLTSETNFYHFQMNLLIHSQGIESLHNLAEEE